MQHRHDINQCDDISDLTRHHNDVIVPPCSWHPSSTRCRRTSPPPPHSPATRPPRRPAGGSRRRSSPSLQLRLLDLLGEIALGLNAQVPGRVEVRLAGREPELVYVEEEQAEPAAASRDDALTARITLRLAEGLKAQVEVAAARESLSVNSWIVRALARGLETRSIRAGRRLTGFAES